MQFPIFSNFADELFEQNKIRRFRPRRTEFFGGMTMPLARSEADATGIVAGIFRRNEPETPSPRKPGNHPLRWRGARYLSGTAKPGWPRRRQSVP